MPLCDTRSAALYTRTEVVVTVQPDAVVSGNTNVCSRMSTLREQDASVKRRGLRAVWISNGASSVY